MRNIELRIGLVCYGGVSLAVYMHGVTRELHAFIEASRRFDGRKSGGAARRDYRADETGKSYYDAFAKFAEAGIELSATIDIIAGTSAGGINGILLAKALARNASQAEVKQLWMKEADLRKLLRPRFIGPLWARAGRSSVALARRLGTPFAPLKAEHFATHVLRALESMDTPHTGVVAGKTLLPDGGSLDLYAPTTDLDGYDVLVPSGSGGFSQRDRHYAQVMHFSASSTNTESFGPDASPALAFACRATSSFPGAFPPIGLTTFAHEVRRKNVLETIKDRVNFQYVAGPNSNNARHAWFVDGGLLNNAPFDLVINAIARKPAEERVFRRLIYIQPDPGKELEVPREEAGGAKVTPPTWVNGVTRSLFSARGSNSLVNELNKLRDMNYRIDQISAIVDQQKLQVRNELEDLAGRLKEGSLERVVAAGADLGSDTVQLRVQEKLGLAYNTYTHLKWDAVATSVADAIAQHYSWAPDSSEATFTKAATIAQTREWASGVEALDLSKYLQYIDIPYRTRRLSFLIAGLNELYAQHEDESLNPVKKRLWSVLDRLNQIPREAMQQLSKESSSLHFLEPDVIRESIGLSLEEFLADHEVDFRTLFVAYAEAVTKLTEAAGYARGALWAEFVTETETWPMDIRCDLAARYLGFPLWDGLIFPTIALSQLPQFTPIQVAQFSPLRATALTPPDPAGKLKGRAFHHFSGFFDEQWRQNDYLWGRLDTAELILRELESVYGEAVRDAGESTPFTGNLLRDVLRAVLDSESDLTKIRELREQLFEQINDIDV